MVLEQWTGKVLVPRTRWLESCVNAVWEGAGLWAGGEAMFRAHPAKTFASQSTSTRPTTLNQPQSQRQRAYT
jgi:hypothetical protein